MKLKQLFLIFWTTVSLVGCAAIPQAPAVASQPTAAISSIDEAATPGPTAPVPQSATGQATATRLPLPLTPAAPATPGNATQLLAVTHSQEQYISLVDPNQGVIAQIEAGAAPWGLVQTADRLYVATAEGIAVIDLARRIRLALVPYQAEPGPPQYGYFVVFGMCFA
jgi:hypothetical protein